MPQQDSTQQPPLSKRWACDRCREHKLRCLRTQARSDRPCVRCARAGASCVTGAPRPLGRSRASSGQASRRRPSRSTVFVAVATPGSTPRASTRTAVPLPPERDAATASSAARARPSTPSSLDCFHDPLGADVGELASMFLDEGPPGGEGADPSVDNPMDFGFLHDTTGGLDIDLVHDRDRRHLTHSPDLCADPAFQLPSTPENAFGVAGRTPEPPPGPSCVLARLAHLNESMAHQLAYADSMVLSEPPTHLISSCADQVGDRQVNPILRALDSTSALAAVIKHIISPAPDQRSPPVTTPVVLMCLSGHIQLLQIYDAVFRRVHRFLAGLRDIRDFFGRLPCFASISGLPPVHGDLYIKLVVQVAQHHIAALERALGLPPQLCLSLQRAPQRAPRESLLGLVDAPGSFRRVMNQACSAAEKSPRALAVSLRTQIGNVLGLLTA